MSIRHNLFSMGDIMLHLFSICILTSYGNESIIYVYVPKMSHSADIYLRIRPSKIVVWLSSTTFLSRCGWVDFFFQIKVNATQNYSLFKYFIPK